ncbi:hypothetical protein AB0H76_32630 [Nocardia sp. NPDC050712]|uniref:hypothetical protein n=1 Tax=Nocardia sp. NPDC050712 TaxID=3155518 RepID=UPI0033F5B745
MGSSTLRIVVGVAVGYLAYLGVTLYLDGGPGAWGGWVNLSIRALVVVFVAALAVELVNRRKRAAAARRTPPAP